MAPPVKSVVKTFPLSSSVHPQSPVKHEHISAALLIVDMLTHGTRTSTKMLLMMLVVDIITNMIT